ncbi:GUN4-like protein [Calothrix sp. NIES-4071]|nr:GUN4-like protein [Calothrix sp. NIES-4071]BAZ55073.1 GUN4-like protein [Calothrix sp. NIES-4105]
MPATFTFALSQNQTFELRCSYGTRRLDTSALTTLINLCEEKYYTQDFDHPTQLKKIGTELYQWLDGKEGWLRQGLADDSDRKIYLDLIQTSEAQALNPQTQKIALGLAHLPWNCYTTVPVFYLWKPMFYPCVLCNGAKVILLGCKIVRCGCYLWLLLRIYRDTRSIEGLVTRLRTERRETSKFKPPETEFLDENKIIKVASRGEIVGRRRALQRCLRTLRETFEWSFSMAPHPTIPK